MAAHRVTLQDVANASGVSRATVSFVLNKSSGQTISAATRERVEQAAQQLGYVPNGLARALREGSSRIVVLNISSRMEGNYSQSFIHGLDDELARRDHMLLVQHQDMTPQRHQQLLDLIKPRRIIQFAERYLAGYEIDEDEWDHGFAGHQATQIQHLVDRGHTDIAMALPSSQPPLSDLRLEMANAAAKRAGVPALARLALDESSPEASAECLHTFRDKHPGVTAIAGFLDDVALRVVKAALNLGLEVPADLAVIGYDATSYAGLTNPTLTTVLIDAEAHGRQAARSILGLDDSDLHPQPAQIVQGATT